MEGETIISCESSIEDIYIQLFQMDDDEIEATEEFAYKLMEALVRYRMMMVLDEGH